MNKLLILGLIFGVMACGESRVFVNTNEERIASLEEKQKATDALNALQSQMDEVLSLSIQALDVRVTALEAGQQSLLQLLEDEAAAREAGDENLANELSDSVSAQAAVNAFLQGQIDALNANMTALSAEISSLQSIASSNSGAISTLQSHMASLSSDISLLSFQLQADVSGLQSQINALSSQLASSQVKVYACKKSNNTLSKERFFKIGGKFFGAMNYVTTGTSSVVAGSTPVTVNVPKLCRMKDDHDETKLPNNGGQCTPANDWEVIPGTGVSQTVAQFTSSNITVVTSVQIALEELLSNVTYVTTDNSPACTFTTNTLVEVQ